MKVSKGAGSLAVRRVFSLRLRGHQCLILQKKKNQISSPSRTLAFEGIS